jgi:hypothetical protein
MRLNIKLFLISLTCLLTPILFECRSDKSIPNLCFQNDILPIFITKCALSGCHDGSKKSETYNLTTYEGIMLGITPRHPLQSTIYNAIRGGHAEMPPENYPPLSAKDKDKIKSWINFGAINSNCSTNCDTTKFTYSGEIKPILETWCTGCHNASNPSGGYDLSNYNGAVKAVTNNVLIGSITYSPGLIGMPQNGGKMNDCNIKLITKWVISGYPNN